MKILLKNFEAYPEIITAVQKALRDVAPYFKMDSIEFNLTNEFKIEIHEKETKIYLDKYAGFFSVKDEKATRALILSLLFRVMTRVKLGKYPEVIETLVAKREMAKKGFIKELTYLFYVEMMFYKNTHIKTMPEFIQINIPWVTFYKTDDYNYNYFLKLKNEMKYDENLEEDAAEFLDALKKDFWMQENLNSISLYYEAISCK